MVWREMGCGAEFVTMSTQQKLPSSTSEAGIIITVVRTMQTMGQTFPDLLSIIFIPA